MSLIATCVNLTTGNDIDGNSTATTASITPPPNRLIFIGISSETDGISTNPNTPTVTGCGLTWAAVNNISFQTSGTTRRKVSVLSAMGLNPTTGTLAIDFGGQNQGRVTWVVDYTTDPNQLGASGAGAIVQSVTNKDESGPATSLTVTLASFGNPNNATYGVFGIDEDLTDVAGSGFTIIGNSGVAGGLSTISEFKNNNDTTVDMSWSGGTVLTGGIAIEVKQGRSASFEGSFPNLQVGNGMSRNEGAT